MVNPEPSDIDPYAEPAAGSAVVFRGPKPLCHEYSLVLEAKAIEHEMFESGGSWVLGVSSTLAHRAYEEMSRATSHAPNAAPP